MYFEESSYTINRNFAIYFFLEVRRTLAQNRPKKRTFILQMETTLLWANSGSTAATPRWNREVMAVHKPDEFSICVTKKKSATDKEVREPLRDFFRFCRFFKFSLTLSEDGFALTFELHLTQT